jgi:DNA replication licensing factor MCM3
MDPGDELRLREIQREYLDFLDDDQDQGFYSGKVKDMISENRHRLIVNVNDLRAKKFARAKAMIENSFEELGCFQRALKEFVSAVDATYAKNFDEFLVGFDGSFGANHVSPRTLISSFIGTMICVEGIVTKVSLINPKVVRSVHYCPATKKVIERKYTDMTSLDAFPSSSAYPTKDDEGNLLETEFGLSKFKDHQTFTVQEMPEKAPAGQLPRSVDIIVDDDLVDLSKPGDRVQVVGTYRCLPSKNNGFTNATFRTVLIANNVQILNKEVDFLFTTEDVKKIKKFAHQKQGDVFDILSGSIAPSIHGHDYIKKAILCMLLGGVEKILPNGTRLRGDINCLLIGDPSVAKSQILRYVLHTAPRAIATTGRGSSGVGLTAAVTTDQETGERRLEAGAMVLADRGIVCIDEFDKMSDIDRTAIHEVMEQGKVTIAKAGIQAKLNARCSVLAAANPIYGRYDAFKTPMENIAMQDSLLSRFDLIFVILDTIETENDRTIADHVIRMHRYRAANEQDGEPLPFGCDVDLLTTLNQDESHESDLQVYDKYDPTLHGPAGFGKNKKKFVNLMFMRKYIHLAKGLKPQLTKEAADLISEEYTKLRNQDNLEADHLAKTQPVTARTLETLIRLATSHAKARLSNKVEARDADVAIELIRYACFKKVEVKEKRRRVKDVQGDEEEEEEEHEEVEGETEKENENPSQTTRSRNKRPAKAQSDENEEEEEEDDEAGGEEEEEEAQNNEDDMDTQPRKRTRRRTKQQSQSKSQTVAAVGPILTSDKLKDFKSMLFKLFHKERTQSLSMKSLMDYALTEQIKFTENDIKGALSMMQDDNQIMLSDDTVFLI